MALQAKPLVEITRQAIRVLCREIGVVNTARFMSQFTAGYGDYTEERAELFADMTLDELIDEMKRKKEQPGASQ
jgi:hypothetical protein